LGAHLPPDIRISASSRRGASAASTVHFWLGNMPVEGEDKCCAPEPTDRAADQLASVKLADGPGTNIADAKSGDDDDDQEVNCKDRDPELWKPHPPTEECPVCLVPLPLSSSGRNILYLACCGRRACCACVKEHLRATRMTNAKRHKKKLPPIDMTCAFCRAPFDEETPRLKKRMELDDAWAVFHLAQSYNYGLRGQPKDERKALELYHRAADLGCVEAISQLGFVFLRGSLGNFNVSIDKKKGWALLEDAAKKGSIDARYNLGTNEYERDNYDDALRHFKLAAEAGDEGAVKPLWMYFSKGKLSKADLENTLRAHKDAIDEMNSEDRERLAAMDKAEADGDDALVGIYDSYYHGEIKAKELAMMLKAYHSTK